jgi:hypothetical protein
MSANVEWCRGWQLFTLREGSKTTSVCLYAGDDQRHIDTEKELRGHWKCLAVLSPYPSRGLAQ